MIVLTGISCTQKNWKVDNRGLTVYPREKSAGDAAAVRIVPVGEAIIRVLASADTVFSPDTSLVVIGARPTRFSVRETGERLLLFTSRLQVEVSRLNGRVRFMDLEGRPILEEKRKEAKCFEPIEVDGVKAWSVRQVFESSGEEALYGLGQHQSGTLNYLGRNEELFQYNTKVSVPFLVSTRNYGLLWDNYSFSRYGDPRSHAQLDQFVLYNREGKEGGLTATYYEERQPAFRTADPAEKAGCGSGKDETGSIFVQREERIIDYENLETVKNFPEGFDFNHARIVWEGQIESREDGIHHFLLYYAGYTRIWIDGRLMADKWRTAWNPSVAKFPVRMKKGEKYRLRLEWIPDGGVSYIGLKALSPEEPSRQNDIAFWSEMGRQIDYYFMSGRSMDGVIKNYRQLTGKAQVMPRWAMGFWQSRERYKTQTELLGTLKEFRRRHIPIDNIVQDWSYWPVDRWGSHEFDRERFPDPAGMVNEVHKLNARLMISVWPKFYLGTEHFREFDEKGWMYRQAITDSIRDWIYPGYFGSFYDAYRPEARKLFWKQIDEHLYSLGIDAWWLDATEPDILSNAGMNYRKALMNPTALGPSTRFFNAYALMNAKGIYEGQRAKNPDDRVFILTRSGFAGMQRYGTTTWSGDIGTCWEDLRVQIPAGINFSLSGLPYWSMDIGGFCVQKRFERAAEGSEDLEEWRELNTRWFQFGAFVPVFRSHGQYPYREIWNLAPDGHPAFSSMLYYNRLRYRLMPYIYSLAGKVWFEDYTLMRALAMDFPNDRKVYDLADQYLFGPSLLVCPVYRFGERSREVYLPGGADWYELYSGRFAAGGQKLRADAPYERMPLFVRAGSILPVGPEIEYTGQKPEAPLDIYVYAGADGSFGLYEDEGTNYNYEQGKYSLIPFSWSEKAQELTIGERQGTFPGMVNERVFRIIRISGDRPVPFLSEKAAGETVRYSGEPLTFRLQ